MQWLKVLFGSVKRLQYSITQSTLHSESELRSSMSPKPGIQCVLYTIGFLIKYTTRCAIIISYTVQYVRNKIGDLKPKADIIKYYLLQQERLNKVAWSTSSRPRTIGRVNVNKKHELQNIYIFTPISHLSSQFWRIILLIPRYTP